MKLGQEYEKVIEKIYRELSPDASIVRNDKILGKDSNTIREIDLSIRQNIAGHDILMIVQAKDYKRKVDTHIVGSFASDIEDVRAQKGILICNAGFTKGAIKYASNKGIDLYTIVDASNKKWKQELKIPILLRVFSKRIDTDFGLKITSELAEAGKDKVNLKISFADKLFTLDNGITFTTINELVRNKAKTDFLFIKPGVYNVDLTVPELKYQLESFLLPVISLRFTLTQEYTCYLKKVDPEDYRGINDYINKKLKLTYLVLKTKLDPTLKEDSWEKIDETNLAITPITFDIQIDLPFDQGSYSMTNQTAFIFRPNK